MKITSADLADEQRKATQVLALQGEDTAYERWLTVRDVPSMGRKTRAAGHTVPREHHLLSDLEAMFFLLADFAPDVIDIREQFPLLPIDQTLQIAREMGVRHPWDRKTGKLVVMTTDFLLTRLEGNGCHSYHAYSIKPSSRLTENRRRRKRTLEKLEIERRLWQSLNVPWTLVTEQAFHPIVIENLQWLSYGARDIPPELLTQLPHFLKRFATLDHARLSLAQLLATLADQLCLDDQGAAQQLFCHGVWAHHFQVDLSWPISLSQPIRFLPAGQRNTARERFVREHPESRHA